jgi:phosphoglucosamine mutase
MIPIPQALRSFMVPRREPIDRLPELRREVVAVERELGDEGRVLVRYSGTEAKMRVMVECVDASRLTEYLDRIEAAALRSLGAAA